MRFLKIFKKNSNRKIDNYTFEDIPLNKWIKVSSGEIKYISKDGIENEDCRNAFYKMQDDYILLFGGDSPEMKQYKAVCFEYLNKLSEWIQNPKLIGKLYTEVNELFLTKSNLQKSLFTEETKGLSYDMLVAKASIAVKFRIDPKEVTAKEFFTIIKALNDGNNETD